MSSLIRRLTIRAMKRGGYTREKWVIENDPAGKPTMRDVRRGGEITDPDDTPIGRLWPPLIPARIKAPTLPQKRAFPGADRQGRKPFALRRSKNTEKRLEAQARARGES